MSSILSGLIEGASSILPGLTEGAIFLTLVGILSRGRFHYCRSFVVFLAAVFTGDLLTMSWPSVFYTKPVWIALQLFYAVMKMGIAAELAATVFEAFPGAKARARRTLFVMLIITASMMVGMPKTVDPMVLFREWMPRLMSGTIWLMTGITILVVYYRIPLDPFHRAILTGSVTYNLITVSLYDLLRRYGWHYLDYVDALQAPTYLVLLLYWARASWRPDTVPEAVSPALVQALHPWRARAQA
jgi:hypothetical protein